MITCIPLAAASPGPMGLAQEDPASLLRISETHGPAILRMLQRILGREHDVQDVYQECLCQLIERGAKLGSADMGAYAYQTARNLAITVLRKRKRDWTHLPRMAACRAQAQQGRPDDFLDQEARQEEAALVRKSMLDLPGHLRNVLYLRDFVRLPYAQVARTLGISPATARVYRRLAIISLAASLKRRAS